MKPEIQLLYKSNCSFNNDCVPAYVIRTYPSGITHCTTQCQKCGNSYGQPVSKKIIDPSFTIPPFNEENYNNCLIEIDRPRIELNEVQSKLNEIRTSLKKEYFEKYLKIDNIEFESAYVQYINSEEWKKRRIPILERDNNICKFCTVKKAVQVHHLSYDNLGNESDFELIGVCMQCHQLIHEIEIRQKMYDKLQKNLF
jgi:hypothetical protein